MDGKHLIVGLLLAFAVCGCSGKKTNPFGSLANRFTGKDSTDPLTLDKEHVSEGFVAANKKLQAPEETMLAFAKWKEDMGQYAEAKQRYREILTENEGCLDARLGIARIERATGRFDQCRDILMKANQQYPEDAMVLLELGRTYSERREMDKAIQYLRQAADSHPDEEQVRYELGVALARAGQYDDAIAHLRYSVGESAALFNIGFVLHEDGKTDEARKWIQQSLDSHPDDRTRKSARDLLARIDSESIPNRRKNPYVDPYEDHLMSGQPPVQTASFPQSQSAAIQPLNAPVPLIQPASGAAAPATMPVREPLIAQQPAIDPRMPHPASVGQLLPGQLPVGQLMHPAYPGYPAAPSGVGQMPHVGLPVHTASHSPAGEPLIHTASQVVAQPQMPSYPSVVGQPTYANPSAPAGAPAPAAWNAQPAAASAPTGHFVNPPQWQGGGSQ